MPFCLSTVGVFLADEIEAGLPLENFAKVEVFGRKCTSVLGLLCYVLKIT